MTDQDQPSAAAERLALLEAFLDDADAWAETLEILGRQWAGPNGQALESYASGMRARIRPLLRDAPAD